MNSCGALAVCVACIAKARSMARILSSTMFVTPCPCAAFAALAPICVSKCRTFTSMMSMSFRLSSR